MKKIGIIAAFAAIWGSILTACFDDNSTLGTMSVGKITIEAMKDTAMLSYSGQALECVPTITSDYPEDKLKFTWYIYKDRTGSQVMEEISTDRNLSYEVNLTTGGYVIVYRVTAIDNNYSVATSFRLKVVTAFTQGFYILKETADGKTELDLLSSEGLSMNLLQRMHEHPLEGAPRKISMSYDQCLLDPETKMPTGGSVLTITTEANKLFCVRTTELAQVFNQEDILYEPMEADDKPYGIVRGMWRTFFFTSRGVRSNYVYAFAGGLRGKFGEPLDNGASPYYHITTSRTMIYWNDNSHKLMTIDYQGSAAVEATYEDGLEVPDQSGFVCIASGDNIVGNTQNVWFIMEDKTDKKRYLYLYTGTKIHTIRELDPTLNITQSDFTAENGFTATLIYCLNKGKVYAYNMIDNTEFEVNITGLPANEVITYISNPYWNLPEGEDTTSNFNYFVVGTKKDNEYTLYMYNMLGGQPHGEPISINTSQGKLKGICFASQANMTVRAFYQLVTYGPVYSYNQ